MKLTRIDIKNYNQFKDFNLDLTYPEDFSDEALKGRALNKVCIIGQSGTGKTTLINLIQYGFAIINQPRVTHSYNSLDTLIINLGISNITQFLNINFEKNSEVVFYFEGYHSEKLIAFTLSLTNFHENQNQHDLTIKSLPFSNLNAKQIYDDKTLSRLNRNIISYPAEKRPDKSPIGWPRLDSPKEFNLQDAKNALDLILQKITEYRERETEFRINISKKILDQNSDELKREYQKWLTENPNPVKDLADNCLDYLLNKFHLKTKTELDNIKDLSLQIQNLHNEKTIPFESLSTGTKQIIISAVPLYILKLQNSSIFFDEPERSLFPDLQQILIDYYTKFSLSSQFFFATHSPIIASQFKPEERVILKFDEEGNVKASRGEAPEGDDPNDLLMKDFKQRSLLGQAGLKAWNRYVELKSLLKSEQNSEKKQKLASEFMQLGTKYNFGDEENS